jgi:hypothetical protein
MHEAEKVGATAVEGGLMAKGSGCHEEGAELTTTDFSGDKVGFRH